ncbi:MAG: hypothetical protein WDL87_00775 [Candidatus Omnitrophota bacterium]|jgi:hypothetical protein
MIQRFIFLLFLVLGMQRVAGAEELKQFPAAIQISSTASDGSYSLSEIAAAVRKNNFSILIITERDLMRWQYGFWPFSRIMQKTVEEKSLFKYGIKRYLNEIQDLERKNPDLVIIPGVESAPFYYWQGSFWKGTLSLHDWHKHMLAVGLTREADYLYLPVVGNTRGLLLPWRLSNIWSILVPITLSVFGAWLCFSYGAKTFGIAFWALGFLLVWNNYPFRDSKFTQYQGGRGIMPYQNFIDYVKGHGGVTFWSHPEAENTQKVGWVKVETLSHEHDLYMAKDYTGFSVFYEGYEKIGIAGGIWDEVLSQYCRGARLSPVWAIAGLSFDADGDLSEALKDLRTVFLLHAPGKSEVLQALKRGSMYVSRGRNSSQFSLDSFMIIDAQTQTKGVMGETLASSGNIGIVLKGHFLNGQAQPFRIKLISNGKVIRSFETQGPVFDILFNTFADNKIRSYFRAEVESPGLACLTNPIFVSPITGGGK